MQTIFWQTSNNTELYRKSKLVSVPEALDSSTCMSFIQISTSPFRAYNELELLHHHIYVVTGTFAQQYIVACDYIPNVSKGTNKGILHKRSFFSS